MAHLRNLIAAASFAGLCACQTQGVAGACTPGDQKLAGHYYLEGIMEVGSELLLRPDGSFEFGLAYGALDQYGKGCWKISGSSLALVPEGRSSGSATHSFDQPGFDGMVLAIDGADLVWRVDPRHVGRFVKG